MPLRVVAANTFGQRDAAVLVEIASSDVVMVTPKVPLQCQSHKRNVSFDQPLLAGTERLQVDEA